MSIMRCTRHDQSWDSDFVEHCPTCEALDVEVTEVERGFTAHFRNDPDDGDGVAWGYATTEDEAICNLMEIA